MTTFMKLDQSIVANHTTIIVNVNHIRHVTKAYISGTVIVWGNNHSVNVTLNTDEVFDALRGLPIPGVTLIKA